MKTQYKVIGIVIVALIFLGIIFLFKYKSSSNIVVNNNFSSNTSNNSELNTANWKVYKNQKYGYGISYPESWTDEETDKSVTIKNNKELDSSENVVLIIRLVNLSDPEFKIVSDRYSKFYSGEGEASDSGHIKLQNITINSYPGIKLLQFPTKEIQEARLIYQLKSGDSYYIISFASFSENWWNKNSAIVTKIVESFTLPAPSPKITQSL